MKPKVLIVEDEPGIADTLQYALRTDGFEPAWCATGEEALQRIREAAPALVILDVGLPDASGFEIFKRLRATSDVPVVFLTARSDEIDRVVGLELGADDYVTKPFSVRELLLRIRAILRRRTSEGAASEDSQIERLRVDLEGHQVWVDDHRIGLTALEFRLLTTLLARRGRVQTREMLLNDVWGMQVDVTTRTVDTHVQRLRKKLGEVGHYIETLRGVGYRFLVPEPGANKASA